MRQQAAGHQIVTERSALSIQSWRRGGRTSHNPTSLSSSIFQSVVMSGQCVRQIAAAVRSYVCMAPFRYQTVVDAEMSWLRATDGIGLAGCRRVDYRTYAASWAQPGHYLVTTAFRETQGTDKVASRPTVGMLMM